MWQYTPTQGDTSIKLELVWIGAVVAEKWLPQNLDGRTEGQKDGRTDAGYFIVPLPGFFETSVGQKKFCECLSYSAAVMPKTIRLAWTCSLVLPSAYTLHLWWNSMHEWFLGWNYVFGNISITGTEQLWWRESSDVAWTFAFVLPSGYRLTLWLNIMHASFWDT